MEAQAPPSLVFIPGHCTVMLTNDVSVQIRADGFSETDAVVRFTVLVVGDPNWELEIAQFPRALVRSIEGGPEI